MRCDEHTHTHTHTHNHTHTHTHIQPQPHTHTVTGLIELLLFCTLVEVQVRLSKSEGKLVKDYFSKN